MSTKSAKYFVILFWIVAIIYIIYVVWANTLPINRNYDSPLFFLNFIQRVSALTVFLLLTDQIVTGAFMDKITVKLGGWFYKLHTTLGIVTYALILAHILSYVVFLFLANHTLNLFYFFTDFCLICEPKSELYISFGRIAFWLITVTILIARFRTLPALRKHWKMIHMFNYLVFLLIAVHSYMVGSDTYTILFKPVYIFGVTLVSATFFYRLIILAKQNITLK